MSAVLEVRDLKRSFYNGRQLMTAVDRVSFSIGPGEILGLVGESGCGKSTTAKMITRLLEAEEGTILLKGKDITHAKGKELLWVYRILQMVFQSPAESFNPRHTLGTGIMESMRNNGYSRADARRRAAELMEQCGLSADFMGRFPHEVSGGQCQRAAIARAIAIEPELLICDEATSALDVTVQAQVVELLGKLRDEKGLSILFICHDLALVQKFCDRVLVMHQGRIVEEGTPDEVIMHPREKYTQTLVDAVF